MRDSPVRSFTMGDSPMDFLFPRASDKDACFLVVLDWVTRTAYASSEKGIQWTLLRKLDDDLDLLSHRLQDIQDKVNALKETAQRVGLTIS